MLIRTYHNGDSDMLRTFDKSGSAPEQPTTTPSYLNLHHERGVDGKVERTRLSDVFVPENQRGQGIGGNLLQAAETNAIDHGAQEIYGASPQDNSTQMWYEKRGYAFRPGSMGGEEVYKVLI
jgi:GNAT superfamily N-acetyltransferase